MITEHPVHVECIFTMDQLHHCKILSGCFLNICTPHPLNDEWIFSNHSMTIYYYQTNDYWLFNAYVINVHWISTECWLNIQ